MGSKPESARPWENHALGMGGDVASAEVKQAPRPHTLDELHDLLATHIKRDATWKAGIQSLITKLASNDVEHHQKIQRAHWPSAVPMWILVVLVSLILMLTMARVIWRLH